MRFLIWVSRISPGRQFAFVFLVFMLALSEFMSAICHLYGLAQPADPFNDPVDAAIIAIMMWLTILPMLCLRPFLDE